MEENQSNTFLNIEKKPFVLFEGISGWVMSGEDHQWGGAWGVFTVVIAPLIALP